MTGCDLADVMVRMGNLGPGWHLVSTMTRAMPCTPQQISVVLQQGWRLGMFDKRLIGDGTRYEWRIKK